jgi:histidinol phosphatase-like enzyme
MFNEVVNQIQDGIEQGLVSAEEVEQLQKAITAGFHLEFD